MFKLASFCSVNPPATTRSLPAQPFSTNVICILSTKLLVNDPEGSLGSVFFVSSSNKTILPSLQNEELLMTTEIDHEIAKIQATGLQPSTDSMSEITSPVNISLLEFQIRSKFLYKR